MPKLVVLRNPENSLLPVLLLVLPVIPSNLESHDGTPSGSVPIKQCPQTLGIS